MCSPLGVRTILARDLCSTGPSPPHESCRRAMAYYNPMQLGSQPAFPACVLGSPDGRPGAPKSESPALGTEDMIKYTIRPVGTRGRGAVGNDRGLGRPAGRPRRSDRWRRGRRGHGSCEQMTASSTASGPTHDDSGSLLSLPPGAGVDEVVEAVRGWIASVVPPAWVEAGRRGGPAAVREVRTRAEYEAWYPAFGSSGLVAATWPHAYGGLDLSPDAARRVEQELGPFNLGRLNPLGLNLAAPALFARWDRGAAASISPSDRSQRGGLVPALQRAGRRFRPRVPRNEGRARRRRAGSSTVRRCGPRGRTSRTGPCSSRAPMSTCPSARG